MRLRFPISAADQLRVVAGSTQATDVPGAAGPPGLPYPQSARLRFPVLVVDPAPLQIRPLGPGTIEFIPDPAAGGVVPAPEDVDFTGNAYDGWKTEGTLLFRLDSKALGEIRALTSDLAIVPTMLWYSKVRITKDFLQHSLPELKADIIGTGGAPTIKKNNPEWHTHAVSRFLAGRYDPQLREGTTAADDDVERLAMPVVEQDILTGDVELVISAAAAMKLYDGTQAQLDVHTPPGIARTDPRHPANGAIPARHVYSALRPHLIDAPIGSELPDAWLPMLPFAPHYYPLRFTRIWQPNEDCSIHFPGQRVAISEGPNQLLDIRLPCHGMVLLAEDPLAVIQNITVTVTGGMRALLVTSADPWREPAADVPVLIDLSIHPQPHIILRRTMAQEMLRDASRPKVDGDACTYFSLRRTLRAFIDHRITGGRLNFGPANTSAGTRKLMNDASAGMAAIVADNRPLTNVTDAQIGPRTLTLRPILAAFFPDTAPAQFVDGSDAPVNPLTKGQVAYYLWQTITETIKADSFKRNFPDIDIACGAPGALHFLGLADYVENPAQIAGETDPQYRHRLARALSTGLEPGALLQFWEFQSSFDGMRDRANPAEDFPGNGHSPVFEGYEVVGGVTRAMHIIDQSPPSRGIFVNPANVAVNPATAADVRISWDGGVPREIWIGANWTE